MTYATFLFLIAMAQSQDPGAWNPETNGDIFYSGGCASDGPYVYLVGGNQSSTLDYPDGFRLTRRYDPASDAWILLADLPMPIFRGTAAVAGGELYLFGFDVDLAGRVLAYEISSDTWRELDVATPPSPGSAVAALDGQIYLVGGATGTVPTGACFQFDPSDESMTELASLPVPVYYHRLVGVSSVNRLYAIGGREADLDISGACQEFDPESNTWALRSATPVRWQGAVFELNGRVYVSGGMSIGPTVVTGSMLEYNPGTDQWRTRASMAVARYEHASAAVNGTGFVYGGMAQTGGLPTSGETFVPPFIGSPPDAPSESGQEGSIPESAVQAGWTNEQIVFSATLTDPDGGQFVRLRVRVRSSSSQEWTYLESALSAQGRVTIPFTIPNSGDYDWQYRVEDALESTNPPFASEWFDAFSNSMSPDFRSDQIAPPVPTGLSPSLETWTMPGHLYHPVTLSWSPPAESGLTHEVEVYLNGAIEATIDVAAGVDQAEVMIWPSTATRTWRVRARDFAGNVSDWTPAQTFRVQPEGPGSPSRKFWNVCNNAAGPAPGPVLIGFMGVVILAVGCRARAPHRRGAAGRIP